MKANQNIMIIGERVILVPYLAEHVPKYHDWMKDPYLLESTASDPLTLEEEYAMQRSWATDEDKCTFIILQRSCCTDMEAFDCLTGMVGDVNIFFNDPECRSAVEIEVMIAEKACWGQGLAQEAVTLMMTFAEQRLGVTQFCAKVGVKNAPSLRLFTKLGYTEVCRSDIFREITLRLHLQNHLDGSPAELLRAGEKNLCIRPFPDSQLAMTEDVENNTK